MGMGGGAFCIYEYIHIYIYICVMCVCVCVCVCVSACLCEYVCICVYACCHILRTSCTLALLVSMALGSTGSAARAVTSGFTALAFAMGSAHFLAEPPGPIRNSKKSTPYCIYIYIKGEILNSQRLSIFTILKSQRHSILNDFNINLINIIVTFINIIVTLVYVSIRGQCEYVCICVSLSVCQCEYVCICVSVCLSV